MTRLLVDFEGISAHRIAATIVMLKCGSGQD